LDLGVAGVRQLLDMVSRVADPCGPREIHDQFGTVLR
jgi:hypothetical protein